jgi:hypothetical protein
LFKRGSSFPVTLKEEPLEQIGLTVYDDYHGLLKI